MSFTTHNDTPEIINSINGTSLQGYVKAEYAELVALFGKPTKGDGYKVDAEWMIQFNGGAFATIYNWKNGPGYCGADGLRMEQIKEWHVGGMSKDSADQVQIAIDLFREKREDDAPKDKVMEAMSSAFEIMDSIRATRGDDYAHVVEGALLVRKQGELMTVLLNTLGKVDVIPEEAINALNQINVEISARVMSKLSTLGKLKEGNTTGNVAEELMGWVDRVMDAEKSGADKIMGELFKDRGGNK